MNTSKFCIDFRKSMSSVCAGVCVTLALAVPVPAVYAESSNATAKVLYVGTYGSGRLFVQLDTQIDEPSCPGSRLSLADTHPQADRVLSMAISASVTGKDVVVHSNGCYGGTPTLGAGTNSWFYLKSD